MSANCNTYDERNKVGDALGAGFTSADKSEIFGMGVV